MERDLHDQTAAYFRRQIVYGGGCETCFRDFYSVAVGGHRWKQEFSTFIRVCLPDQIFQLFRQKNARSGDFQPLRVAHGPRDGGGAQRSLRYQLRRQPSEDERAKRVSSLNS